MPALCAFTVPSAVSYLRLVEHAWTGVWSNIGLQDREAGLRICPTFGPPETVERQFNFEFRAADATGNPHLQLAVILSAGLSGIRDGLLAPEPTEGLDPGTLTVAERAARGLRRLPETAEAALAALAEESAVQAFLPPHFVAAYRANKTAELALGRD